MWGGGARVEVSAPSGHTVTPHSHLTFRICFPLHLRSLYQHIVPFVGRPLWEHCHTFAGPGSPFPLSLPPLHIPGQGLLLLQPPSPSTALRLGPASPLQFGLWDPPVCMVPFLGLGPRKGRSTDLRRQEVGLSGSGWGKRTLADPSPALRWLLVETLWSPSAM